MEQALALLAREIKTLINAQAPWMSTQDMCARYHITPKTLTARQLAGKLPQRNKTGLWSRAEVIEWEMNGGAR